MIVHSESQRRAEFGRGGVRGAHACHRKRWRDRACGPVALLAILGAILSPAPAARAVEPSVAAAGDRDDESTAAPRQRIRALLSELHSPDADIAASALDVLKTFGLSEEQIEWGRKLADPDRDRRARFARSLGGKRDAQSVELLCELSDDESPEVRRAALEAAQGATPSPRLRRRVAELAESENDPQVRGHARLLAADWNLSAPSDELDMPEQPGASPPHVERFPRGSPTSPESAAPRAVPQRPNPTGIGTSSADAGNPFERASPLSRASHAGSVRLDDLPAAAGTAALIPAARDYDRSHPFSDPLFHPRQDEGGARRRPPRDSQPGILDRPIEPTFPDDPPLTDEMPEMLFRWDDGAPLGFTGPSGVAPTEVQESAHFVPVEDRWRSRFPAWDRYGKGHPPVDDYPYVEGHWWDPYNQNVLKGDYPIWGQHTFLNITAIAQTIQEYRQVPTGTTPFESTVNPFQEEFFGNPNQYFTTNFLKLRFDLFHGNAAFKPFDWQVRLTPVFNANFLKVHELGIVGPDTSQGTRRARDDVSLEEYFAEVKLADLSPDYDFLSLRVGSQPFVSDFRGFIFADVNRGVRLFGTRLANRDQFNVILFDQTEKDTNSGLNTFDDRHQNTIIANYYRQDFVFPGYTAQLSFHYNHDGPSFEFDTNGFLVRPDPAGIFQQHKVDACYFGFAGEGHMERINIANAFYYVRGRDSRNPLAGRDLDINAKMAAVELSYDRDWVRFRSSFFWSSGDDDIFDDKGRGFDTILDNPNFAGGGFSYWQRQSIRLFGVNLMQRESLVPNLRSSKTQGQSNFVNPGLVLVNAGMDFEITPRLRSVNNVNYLWFESTRVLEQFTFQDKIRPEIGLDISSGIEYRPFLNDNVILEAGVATLIPGDGIHDLYGITDPFDLLHIQGNTRAPTMVAAFMDLALTF